MMRRLKPAAPLPEPDEIHPTEEQQAIISLARNTSDNIQIRALAGCGKTSTLEMVECAGGKVPKPILYLVFNKRNAEEAEERMLSTTTVRNFNSLGHRIWAGKCGRNLKLNTKKTQDIFKGIVEETPKAQREVLWQSYWEVITGVGLAKALGYVPDSKFPNAKRLCSKSEFHRALDEEPDDLTSDLIDACLTRSIVAGYEGYVDFNDQLYLPAIFGGPYPKFPLVLVDEAQDMSPVNHEMVARLSTDKSGNRRLIVVGDPFQSIYGFRGAQMDGMEQLVSQYSMTITPLSVSFRCPRAIVENARWRVPEFKWIKDGGHAEQLKRLDSNSIPDDAVFICRNNAPLFSVGFKLLASGRSVSIAGSDIGPKVVGIMRRLGPESLTRDQTLGVIDEWLATKLERESKTAVDIAECMKVFAKHGNSLGTAIAYAEHLFEQCGTIQLLTGHKAKGLEFNCVYHLDPDLIGNFGNLEQELNLRYVIQTRSRDRYYEINSGDIAW